MLVRVKRALPLNAAACIINYNHSSRISDPSSSDRAVTSKLKDAMALVDIRLLDQFIVSGTETYSFAEFGLIWSGDNLLLILSPQ